MEIPVKVYLPYAPNGFGVLDQKQSMLRLQLACVLACMYQPTNGWASAEYIYASCSRDTIKVLRSIKNKKKVKCTMFISPSIGGTIHRIGLHASICSRFFEPTYDHQKPTYVYHSILSTSGNLHSLNHTHRSQWWSNSYGQVGTRWLSFWSEQVASCKQEEEMGLVGDRWELEPATCWVRNCVLPVQTREKKVSLSKKNSVPGEGFCGDHPSIHFQSFLRHKSKPRSIPSIIQISSKSHFVPMVYMHQIMVRTGLATRDTGCRWRAG
jgi:hypothetical protein